MSVNVKYGLLLAATINFTILASYLFEIIARKFNLHIFSLSFDEGAAVNVIEIQSNQAIDVLHDSKFLLQYVSDKKQQEFHYKLAAKSRGDIENIRKSIDKNKNIESIEVRFY